MSRENKLYRVKFAENRKFQERYNYSSCVRFCNLIFFKKFPIFYLYFIASISLLIRIEISFRNSIRNVLDL